MSPNHTTSHAVPLDWVGEKNKETYNNFAGHAISVGARANTGCHLRDPEIHCRLHTCRDINTISGQSGTNKSISKYLC